MKSFLMGTVLDPEIRHIKTKAGDKRDYVVFGILSGRVSTEFQVWDNDRSFDKVKSLGDGQFVCIVVNDRVDDKGKIAYYQHLLGRSLQRYGDVRFVGRGLPTA